eukprot:gb/GEZN01026958.1/.p1 GENE.gb/GEZN01026958.1/~~gb/GEZN01026958.1/.p1  ORF type:complete len:145 (+),score=15.72 gb/GEZN01026958.1/:2-436(+)
MGLALTVNSVAEVPIFFFASDLISTLGYFWVMTLALVCFAVRFWTYTLVSQAWMILPVELLHGVCLGAGWSAATAFVQSKAPNEYRTTAQGILQAVQWGLGVSLGGLLSGQLYAAYGPVCMFRSLAVAGIFPVLLVCLRSCFNR